MSTLYKELKELLGRPDGGHLTAHIDFEGKRLVLHFSEKGGSPRGVQKVVSILQMERHPYGPDQLFAAALKEIREELEGTPAPANPRPVMLV